MDEKSIDLGKFEGFLPGTFVVAADIYDVSEGRHSRIKVILVNGSFISSSEFGTSKPSREKLETSLQNLLRVWREKESAAHEAAHQESEQA